jgi:hypothetical protein
MKLKKSFEILLIFFFCFLLILPFLLKTTKANSLGEGYLFLERTQTNTATGMTGMFTPSTDFNTETRELRIIFPESEGAWCKDVTSTVGNLTIAGVTTSPVDQGDWNIGAALPGTLVATCNQGGIGENDYISITGIGSLTGGTSYGFEIDVDGAVFKTGVNDGSNLISYQLIQGEKIETITFSIALLSDDQVTVSAEVSEADTITCTLSTSALNMGTLFRGGAYITGGMSLTTESTSGFYWAVYGQGDGTNAGLYTSEGIGDLLSSQGVEGEVNLLAGEGFGMLANSSQGYVPIKYTLATMGVFGSIGQGTEQSSVFLYANPPTGSVSTNITFGARAGADALAGSYEETITYICGGYVGGSELADIEMDAASMDGSEDCSTIAIGEECGGGIVAYHDGVGGGLIAASADNSSGTTWGCGGTSITTSTNYGEGSSNTSAILLGCASRPIAASICDAYDGGAYNDWFLPSLDELEELYNNRIAIGGFNDEISYWSSSQDDSHHSWTHGFFSGGTPYSADKDSDSWLVRCVRFF